MAKSKSKSSTSRTVKRPRRAPRGGIGWLVLLFIVGGALGLVVFQPGLVSGLFADPAGSSDKGKPPTSTSNVDAEAGFKDIELDSKGFSGADKGLSAEVADKKPEVVDKKPAPKVQVKDDDAKALGILDEATAAYHGMDWDGAERTLRRLGQLDVSEEVKAKAETLQRNAKGLSGLFEQLGADKEELMRNIMTHPSLILVQNNNTFVYYVPLQSMDGDTIITSEDPAASFKAILKRAKKAPVMNGRRIKVMLDAGAVGQVENADLAKLKAAREEKFRTSLAKMEASDELRADPMAWYSAARYAYQNRLDDAEVVRLLEEAWVRDPDLATTIREDKASDLYAAMVLHLQGNNKQAAGSFMYKLEKQYKDTSIYAQARAHFDGELDKLAKVHQEVVAKKKEQRREARERRMEQAKKQKDEKKIEEIQREERKEQQFEEQMAAVTGDVGKGDELFAKGEAIYQQAVNMEACPQRDTLYSQAQPYFEQAMAIYQKCGAEAKMVSANQLRYACIKMRRPF